MPRPEMRVSDAERNQVVEQLNQAVGEGRLTLAEFEDRIGGVLAARTHADLAPFTADLPAAAAPQVLELRSRASSLKRAGRWVVPRQVVVEARSSKVRLDLTDAVITSPTVQVSLNVRSSSLTLVLPPGASASIDQVEMSSSTAKQRVPDSGGLHIHVSGKLQSSSLKVRRQRRFLRWRW
ncbi:DUF1707 domain-containing protein [Micromonospora sp. DR5-3]|uniref:DUF1707 SHOCT-like domain-containing protein n=1 Tax=unclassified Micromonospora TaxID=2617518 RepID=UPI0011D57F5B|nr:MULTISPECIES: DUF1707 domain-containing protein [unclassified Micromonospora]MCW3813997.1 DUF1707 domain-containing protein [Micromonospora sp. DR5-3]TYC23645.1 DUF1707 domain-containing protein [Micromonospora sp. MP36]